MRIDLDEQKEGESWQSDYCIIGAGIAGLILAKRLAASGATVHLLEAGGFDLEERSQALFQAEMREGTHTGTTEGRFRSFGGSSIRWGGQLLPYTADVFQPPPSSGGTAWPIGEEALTPYYHAVQELMHAGNLPFTDQLLAELGQAASPLGTDLRLRYSKWAPFARRNLGKTIGEECLADPSITVFFHANVAELQGEGGGTIATALALNYNGASFRFKAKCFVVAAGTVESCRLLLLSPAVPDVNGQVGRYFHDHVAFHAAVIPVTARKAIFQRFGPFFVNGVLLTPKLEATPELCLREHLLNTMAHFVIQEPEGSGLDAVRSVLTAVQRRRPVPPGAVAGLLRGMGDVLRFAWALKVRKRRALTRRAQVWLNIDMEQPPSADSRVSLSEAVDSLGIRKAVVHWRVGPQEVDTAVRFARILHQAFTDAGLGPLQWNEGLLNGTHPEMADTYHAMGGLRMGSDPAASVVDRDLRAHGTANLYVASCAVYPSGGSSNPTFTLMALSMRLADHLIKVQAAVSR